MKNGKATGPFSIPVKVLKLLKCLVSKPLEILYNCSFTTGTVPNHFKIAKVILVFKSGSQLILSNYRPISLLSILNKIIEKLMYNKLIVCLENVNCIYNKQFGFRANHSTIHAILLIVDKIQTAIENGKYSCGLFLDLSKAFDTVDHNILIHKLQNFGIRGPAIDWFKSYLSDRMQYVSIGGVKSDKTSIKCGVPQGSVLGPLLFPPLYK